MAHLNSNKPIITLNVTRLINNTVVYLKVSKRVDLKISHHEKTKF